MNDINFTFGIVTDHTRELSSHLPKVIQSIKNLNIPNHEILIVGDQNQLKAKEYYKDIRVVHFTEKQGWITRQKNLITQLAKYENIVYQHDYIYYDPDWYEGFKQFGDNFDVCMNKIKNQDGVRFRDWVIFPWHHCYPMHFDICQRAKSLWEMAGIENNETMLPYDENRFVKLQYISGSYWIAKKKVMKEFLLDESLFWSQGEDCVWSMNVLKKYNFSMNANSTVHFDKQKADAFSPIRPEVLEKCIVFISK